MSSTIEFSNLSANLTGQTNFTISGAPGSTQAVKVITIESGNVSVNESSVFCLTPAVINIGSLALSVSENSTAHLGGSDVTQFTNQGQANFTLLTQGKADVSTIQIDNLDFLGWANNNKENPPPQLMFNFDTSKGPNFGKFIFSGNNNAFARAALFSLGYVYINNESVPYNERRFTVGDYTTGNLIISLTNGD